MRHVVCHVLCCSQCLGEKGLVNHNPKSAHGGTVSNFPERRAFVAPVFSVAGYQRLALLGALLLRGLSASSICCYQDTFFKAVVKMKFQHRKAVCLISVGDALLEVKFLIYEVSMEYTSYNKNCSLTCGSTVKRDWKRWHILDTQLLKVVLY